MSEARRSGICLRASAAVARVCSSQRRLRMMSPFLCLRTRASGSMHAGCPRSPSAWQQAIAILESSVSSRMPVSSSIAAADLRWARLRIAPFATDTSSALASGRMTSIRESVCSRSKRRNAARRIFGLASPKLYANSLRRSRVTVSITSRILKRCSTVTSVTTARFICSPASGPISASRRAAI